MGDARSRTREVLNDRLTPEILDRLFDEVLASKKSGRGWCPNCRKAVTVEVDDAKAVVSALAELWNQAEGRPGTVEAVPEVAPVFVRKVIFEG